jgi:carboxylesterase type B
MASIAAAAQATTSRGIMYFAMRLVWLAVVALTVAMLIQNWTIRSWFITNTQPSVVLRQGKFVGIVLNNAPQKIEAFLGIPYAQPPTGSRRFRPAEPVNDSTTAFIAIEFGPSCPSKQLQRTSLPTFNHSEDCLTANVFRPASARPNLPVAIYVHGGAYNFGTGQFV